MKSSTYGKGARGRATRLHSLLVRSRGRCESCGSTTTLQAAHIVPRRYAATRSDERNAWCLCAACHFRTTERPLDFLELVDRTIGRAEYDRLWEKARTITKTSEAFWLEECVRLQMLLDEAAA